MNEPKPFASLGPTLLARKGGARPAMRPQMGPIGTLRTAMPAPQEAQEPDLEDLGWNDMGEESEPSRPAPVLSLTPSPHQSQREAAPEPVQAAPTEPEVHRRQRVVAEALATKATEPPRAVAEPQAGRRRAAFTLRLDAQRHLKLRLASTIQGRSAQALVTAALDKFLAEIPEIDALAAQLQRD